jgi:hypothetical protein
MLIDKQRFREFQTFILDGNRHNGKPQKRAEEVGPTGKNTLPRNLLVDIFIFFARYYSALCTGTINLELKGSDQRENRWVWSNVNTRYLV